MDYQKYPNFHTRFIKGVPIDEAETVSLSDLGLPVDVPPCDEARFANSSNLDSVWETTSDSELFRGNNAENHYVRLLLSLNDKDAALNKMLAECKSIGLSHYQLTIFLAYRGLLDLDPGDARALLDEFVFIIETLIPRSIQDLFYFLGLNTHPVYWTFFDLAAEKLKLEKHTNRNKNNYNQFKSHMQEGVKRLILNGESLLDIYENTCATKTIIKEVLRSMRLEEFGGLSGSLGERTVEFILLDIKAKYRREVYFDDFQRVTGAEFNGRYDFVLYRKNEPFLVIEYDGQQHFNYVPRFHETPEGFEQQLYRDVVKTKYCEIKELPLLRIDYMELDDDKPGYIADVINAAIKDPANVEIHRKLREPMMMLSALDNRVIHNQDAVENSTLCGCCSCSTIFISSKITEWDGDSALCPRCGEKAIIADAQGFPITDNFMSIAYDYWI
ncbi:MAG: hypothetical protein GX796_12420 [Clostridiaceae bacterium]|jgi:hypothetical protein|nr:hypothetical protein [Clostridiaceae bacterium]